MLRIERATLQFGDRPLLQAFDWQLKVGGMECLTGESGCGKTSLLRAVLGFVPFVAGQIKVDGLRLSAVSVDEIRRRVAYVPQELFLSCEWVGEMVRMLFELKANQGREFSCDRLLEIWEELGLPAELYQYKVSKLSGGQRQRILLSIGILLNKKLLLVDEPTSALDGESARRVAALLRKTADKGTTIGVVSHDVRLAGMCDRVICLSDRTTWG